MYIYTGNPGGAITRRVNLKEKIVAVLLMAKNTSRSRLISCLDRKIVFLWFRPEW